MTETAYLVDINKIAGAACCSSPHSHQLVLILVHLYRLSSLAGETLSISD